ncbi:MAG: hypothetical protein AAF927_28060 [Bacteroidota bacterium]
MPILRYHDQNNNLYHLEDRQFRYRPTQAEESSSDLYSGGEPAEHQISEALSQQIFALAQELLRATRLHTEPRRMLTAIIALKDQAEGQRATLSRSALRTKLEGLLQAALSTKNG